MDNYEHNPKTFVDEVRDTLAKIGKKSLEKQAQCGCSGGTGDQPDQKQLEVIKIQGKLSDFSTRFISEWVRSLDDAKRSDFSAALDDLADMSTFEAIEMMRCHGHCSPFELLMSMFQKDGGQQDGPQVEIVLDEETPTAPEHEGIPGPIV